MFHKHLDQASKRYKQHPNVAAIYTSLPNDEAIQLEQDTSPQSQPYPPETRDFAYNNPDPETNTHAFIANFADSGFRSHHRRVNSRDSLATDDCPPQGQERRGSETTTATTADSASSDLSGTTAAPSSANSATAGSAGDEDVERRRIGVCDYLLMLALAVCLLECGENVLSGGFSF